MQHDAIFVIRITSNAASHLLQNPFDITRKSSIFPMAAPIKRTNCSLSGRDTIKIDDLVSQ